jgi:hypothetical protein
MPRYRVIVGYLTARTGQAALLAPSYRGITITTMGFHAGAILPWDVPAEDIANYLASGMIEPVAE